MTHETNIVGDDVADTKLIRQRLQVMFNEIDEQLANSINAVVTGDRRMADDVRRGDDVIDNLEIEIDRLCEGVLAGRPSNRETIRFVMTAIKINTDLERIGDHCKNLARAGVEDPLSISEITGDHFERMMHAVRGMLYGAHDAWTKGNQAWARRLISNEATVNVLHRKTLDLLVEGKEESEHAFALGARIFALSKALERIADHCVNIAESVVFWLEGIDVRHGGRSIESIHATE